MSSFEGLRHAWEVFRTGKMHKRDVTEFSMYLEDHLFALQESLSTGTYQHDAYERFYIDDPKRRYISKASVRDRIVHQALVNTIEPIVEPSFIYDSYSSRVGKGTHAAVERLDLFLRQASRNGTQRVFALKCDIRKYFDSVRHDLLLEKIHRHVTDNRLFGLVEVIIHSHTSDVEKMRGLPLGNVTSQLFANLYLNGFDHWVKEQLRMRWYLRFCDDFIIVHHNRRYLELVINMIRGYLESTLDLQLHPSKISIRTYTQGIDFVGWVLRPHARVLRQKTKFRLLRNVSKISKLYVRELLENENFRQSIQSTRGILSLGNSFCLRNKIIEKIIRIIQKKC